jgi:hypothetical protein
MESLVKDIEAKLFEDIAASRKLTVEEVERLFSFGSHLAQVRSLSLSLFSQSLLLFLSQSLLLSSFYLMSLLDLFSFFPFSGSIECQID